MATISTIQKESTWGTEATKINQNFTNVNTELTKLNNTYGLKIPLFSSTSAASTAIPSPYEGQLILVGSSLPASVYRWNGSSWANTGTTGGSASAPLTDYYTKEEVDASQAEQDEKLAELSFKKTWFISDNIDALGTFLSDSIYILGTVLDLSSDNRIYHLYVAFRGDSSRAPVFQIKDSEDNVYSWVGSIGEHGIKEIELKKSGVTFFKAIINIDLLYDSTFNPWGTSIIINKLFMYPISTKQIEGIKQYIDILALPYIIVDDSNFDGFPAGAILKFGAIKDLDKNKSYILSYINKGSGIARNLIQVLDESGATIGQYYSSTDRNDIATVDLGDCFRCTCDFSKFNTASKKLNIHINPYYLWESSYQETEELIDIFNESNKSWMINSIFAEGSDVTGIPGNSILLIQYKKIPIDYNKKLYLAYCGKKESSTSGYDSYLLQVKDEDGVVVSQYFRNLPAKKYGVQDYEVEENNDSGISFVIRANLDDYTAHISFLKKLEIILNPLDIDILDRTIALENSEKEQSIILEKLQSEVNGSYPTKEVISNSSTSFACNVKSPSDDIYIINTTCDNPIFTNYDIFYSNEDLSTVEVYKRSCTFGKNYEVPKHSTLEYLYLFNNRETSESKSIAFVTFSTKNSIKSLAKKSLEGKRFVLFADSIGENKDVDGKRWSDYFAEETGSTIFNAAIGGTRMSMRYHLNKFVVKTQATKDGSITVRMGSRRNFTATIATTDTVEDIARKLEESVNEGSAAKPYVKAFGNVLYNITGEGPNEWFSIENCSVETETGIRYEFISNNFAGTPDHITDFANNNVAYAALDIPSMVAGLVTQDWNNHKEAAEYLKNNANDDNTSIINEISNVDINDIDGIILSGGTNNYADTSFGEPAQMPTNSVAWHLETIIKELLKANSKLQIYILTPICRYFGKDISNWDDTKWCDNYKFGDNEFIAMTALVDAEIAVAKYWHIPIFDLYYSLGWNKWNFHEYFNNTDGTHPKKGYSYLGKKIARLIENNNAL